MILECLIVCSGYDDYLGATLPTNKLLFDKTVVVTSLEDKATHQLCSDLEVEFIATDDLETKKGHFRKGLGLDKGLKLLSKEGWVLNLDADIWLPPQARKVLEAEELDETKLYGIDRYMVPSRSWWEDFTKDQESYTREVSGRFKMDPRIMYQSLKGDIPIGFFQLWNPEGSGIVRYPSEHLYADDGDISFSAKWPDGLRKILDNPICYHLSTEDYTSMINWRGRKTRRF